MQVPFNTEARSVSLQEARSLYFGRGELPEALLDNNVLRSWERCRQAGLDPARKGGGEPDLRAVSDARERNRTLLSHAQPVLEHLFEQIRNSHSMVILADSRFPEPRRAGCAAPGRLLARVRARHQRHRHGVGRA